MAETSKPLMLSWRFAPLFWCQFFSAFNDNFLKNAIVFLILFHMGSRGEALITLAGAVFIAPYFFLSALGGEMADRYDKAVMAQRLKLVEIGVAAVAVIGFVTSSLVILFIALAGFGVIGSLFGPIKYGILPDHLERRELPAGNALVEGATFIAILLGTIAGGIAAKGGGSPLGFSALVMVFALLCWVSALLIPRTGEAAPNLIINKNIATSTWTLIQDLRADQRLWWGALVTSWFWLAGVVVLSLLPPAVKGLVGGNEYAVTAYLAVFSIAVAIGSGLAAFLASGRIILLPTLLGALLLAAFALFMGWSLYGAPQATDFVGPLEVFRTARGVNVAIALTGLAIGGGLFIVPAFAAVQAWAGADRRARVIAAVNILNALFMTVATLVVAVHRAWRRQPDRGRADRLHHADPAVRRCAVDHLSRLFPRRGARPRKPAEGEAAERHSGAQPCELPRRWHRAVAARARPAIRDRYHHGAEMVGQTVRTYDPSPADRSAQADGNPHADPGGGERRDPHHLSRGPAHHDRLADEGL
jgi:acyl-[acyl-carrier-protein]-phospholipid O-acyltransferase/long-chain-fatty-acid--[acyl-carrier-protein] ligase